MSRAKKIKTEEPKQEQEETKEEKKNPELEAIQEQIDKINVEEDEKIMEIQKEYRKKRQPLFKQRNKICAKIPNFWLTTFVKHPGISGLLSDEDQKVLSHLKDVDVEDIEDDTKTGFRVTFTFEKNEWFENEQIWKEVIHPKDEKDEPENAPAPSASDIKWKDGKDLTKQSAENVDEKSGKRKFEEQSTSFFSLFHEEEDTIWESIRTELWQNAIDIYYDEAYISEYGDEEDDDDSNDEEEAEEEEAEEAGDE